LPHLRKIGLHWALSLLSMGISFCFFVFAVVQAHVEDGFEDDQYNEQGGGRADGHCQKAAGQDGDVHDDDAAVGAAHQLFGPGGGVLTFKQIILNEGDAVTYKQRQNGKSYLRRYSRTI